MMERLYRTEISSPLDVRVYDMLCDITGSHVSIISLSNGNFALDVMTDVYSYLKFIHEVERLDSKPNHIAYDTIQGMTI